MRHLHRCLFFIRRIFYRRVFARIECVAQVFAESFQLRAAAGVRRFLTVTQKFQHGIIVGMEAFDRHAADRGEMACQLQGLRRGDELRMDGVLYRQVRCRDSVGRENRLLKPVREHRAGTGLAGHMKASVRPDMESGCLCLQNGPPCGIKNR